jgi:hypothetical protein
MSDDVDVGVDDEDGDGDSGDESGNFDATCNVGSGGAK